MCFPSPSPSFSFIFCPRKKNNTKEESLSFEILFKRMGGKGWCLIQGGFEAKGGGVSRRHARRCREVACLAHC